MEKRKRITRIFLAMLFAFTFFGCEEIAECVFNINPEIHDRRLLVGVVGERYEDYITAEVKNDVNDDDYGYEFDIFGNLPPGLIFDFDRRSIEIFGRPEESGVYRFSVELFVTRFDENGFDGSPTCKESTTRDFVIQVLD